MRTELAPAGYHWENSRGWPLFLYIIAHVNVVKLNIRRSRQPVRNRPSSNDRPSSDEATADCFWDPSTILQYSDVKPSKSIWYFGFTICNVRILISVACRRLSEHNSSFQSSTLGKYCGPSYYLVGTLGRSIFHYPQGFHNNGEKRCKNWNVYYAIMAFIIFNFGFPLLLV